MTTCLPHRFVVPQLRSASRFWRRQRTTGATPSSTTRAALPPAARLRLRLASRAPRPSPQCRLAAALAAASPPPASEAGLDRAAGLLLVSQALATWGSRTWSFAVALLLLELLPGAGLAAVSAYGLADCGLRLLASPAVGRLVDRHDRLAVASACYAAQHGFVALSCAAAFAALRLPAAETQARAALAAALLACGAIAGVGSAGAALSTTREWPRALCGGDARRLTLLNARLRSVDLFCAIVAPAAAAALLSWLGSPRAVLFFAACNVASLWPERWALGAARRAVPALARPPEAAAEGRARHASPLALYLSQPDLAAAASKALLYLTVLSVASLLMTGYLCWAGVPKAEVALFRGAGAATGLLATVAVPLLSRRLPLLVVGRISIAY